MTKLDEFIIKWNGKFLEAYDASNLNQCYDLITAWANYIGLPAPMTLYAYQIYDACPQGWTRKQNNATAKPEAGAIVVWMKGYGGGVAGHTAVATDEAGIGWTYADGVFIAPAPEPTPEPEPVPVLTTEQKLEAAGLTVAELKELFGLN